MSDITVPSASVSEEGPSLSAILSSVVHQDLKSSSLLVVRLYDTVKAVKVHKVNIRSSKHVSLLKYCTRVGYPTLLVNAISYSPQ